MSKRLFFVTWFVRNRKFLTSFFTTSSKYFSTVSAGHSLSETVFVSSLSSTRLECSLTHRYISLCVLACFSKRLAKVMFFTNNTSPIIHFLKFSLPLPFRLSPFVPRQGILDLNLLKFLRLS